jgi:hypothetical protein
MVALPKGHLLPLVLLASCRADSQEECATLGYTADLRCSTCEALEDLLGADSPHIASCKGCCHADAVLKYKSATISACK